MVRDDPVLSSPSVGPVARRDIGGGWDGVPIGAEGCVVAWKDGGLCAAADDEDEASGKYGVSRSSSGNTGADGGMPCWAGALGVDDPSTPGGSEGIRRASARRNLSFSERPSSGWTGPGGA